MQENRVGDEGTVIMFLHIGANTGFPPSDKKRDVLNKKKDRLLSRLVHLIFKHHQATYFKMKRSHTLIVFVLFIHHTKAKITILKKVKIKYRQDV